jgi:copper resistance protein D
LELLVDLFGYLSVVLHGLTILAQSMAVGGTLFLVLLARPLTGRLGADGRALTAATARVAAWGAVALVGAAATTVALQTAMLTDTIDLPIGQALTASFALAGLIKVSAAVALVAAPVTVPAPVLLILAVVELAAATLTTHAAARLDGRAPLLLAAFLHQFGAEIWIGGIPCFLFGLAGMRGGIAWRLVGSRFSGMSMAGVACILAGGVVMSVSYIGDWRGFYGTAYGVMVSAKIIMFLMLLGLGGLNFLRVALCFTQSPLIPGAPIIDPWTGR